MTLIGRKMMTQSIGKHQRCPECQEWGWFGGAWQHKCKPCFYVRIDSEDYRGQEARVFAETAQEAAERFVDRWEWGQCEFPVASGNEEMSVLVCNQYVFSALEKVEEDLLQLEYDLKSFEEIPEAERDEEEVELLDRCKQDIQERTAIAIVLREQVERFSVSGETVPVYTAKLVKPG